MTDEPRSSENEAELLNALEAELEDPIGDETDGEAAQANPPVTEAEIAAAEDTAELRAETEPAILAEADGDSDGDGEPEFQATRPPAKLERLQKILAQAGVASRRKAEEMIEQGRVEVNGKVVTEPGTKADAGRDHIRVDGKLLHGAERHRYFVLNKPRGFVTTVKDPEGRPTVMQFFEKMRERLYPVGRLDYMSEGLLLVTNDGELANKLTRASAGVEKTYLVKVAGIPTEGELDILRAGVAIEKGKPGSGKVRTSPARIRQVRQGDNPWYEVVLIEGRNRELRKMFEEIGHFVEKIRRVGYGPLILDQEPGKLRELDEQELELLRKAADGKWKTPKAKEIRRRNIVDALPPQKAALRDRGAKPAAGPKDYRPKKAFGGDAARGGGERPKRFGTGSRQAERFGAGTGFGSEAGTGFGSGAGSGAGSAGDRQAGRPGARPAWKKTERAGTPPQRSTGRFAASGAEGAGGDAGGFAKKPFAGKSFGAKPAGRTFGSKPGGRAFGSKPGGRPFAAKPEAARPETARPEVTRRPAAEPREDFGPTKPTRLHIEPVQDFGRSESPRGARKGPGTAGAGRPPFGRSSGPRAGGSGRSGGAGAGAGRPFRGEGGLARPFTTSSGKPRAGGARPSSKPGKDGGRSFGAGSGRGASGPGRPARPFASRDEGARPERRTGSGWKPRPNAGGKAEGGRAGAGERPRTQPGSRPGARPESRSGTRPGAGTGAKFGSKSGAKTGGRPGGFSKPGYKGKAGGSGGKRGGPRPGGKRH